jgi:hypothetical protein
MSPVAANEKKEEAQSPNRPKLSRGLRKHIRREKGRVRRTVEDKKEAEQKIRELYAKFVT